MKILLLLIACVFLKPVSAQVKAIDDARFLAIGGVDQWITIRGNDVEKPVILFLHGGPGSVMSHYDDAIYGEWQRDFVLVNWDQRGAGRTFGRNAPSEVNEDYWMENPLTVGQMTSDGIALSEYLVRHLKKQKIILIATSWGSVLGAQMAHERPDLFYAYVGHAQVVNPTQQLAYSYAKVYAMAKDALDQASMEKLGSIGAPPYDDAKLYGQLFRVIKKYERENSVPAPDSWWKLAAEYNNETDEGYRNNGDDYSFINYVGHKKLGIKAMMSGIDLMKSCFDFKIPVFLIQGENDILTPPGIGKQYFDKITAPKKEFFSLPDAAHGHNQSVVDMQYKILREYLSPLINER